MELNFEELPWLYVDYLSLFDGKEVDTFKVYNLSKLLQDFNIVFWRESKILGYRRKDKELTNFFDIELVNLIECKPSRVFKYIVFRKSIILTDREEIIKLFSERAVRIFEYGYIVREFPFLAKREVM